MNFRFHAIWIAGFLLLPCASHAQDFTVAAASSLRAALEDVAASYRGDHPSHRFEIIYGSSGKMTTQIMNGAPYDIFFAADLEFPARLHLAGFAATEPRRYAIGRIVLWSSSMDASQLTLERLATDARIRRIAIAQPAHAPYGQRAQEAMVSAGVWEAVQPRLVYGENIAHAAQMVESGAATVGVIALSLALFPNLVGHPYYLIDDALHAPLAHGYVVTRRAADNDAALDFARFIETDAARGILERHGFDVPR